MPIPINNQEEGANQIIPEPGFPIPNKPKRKTHAAKLINITVLMPNLRKKNGIAKINNASDICETDMNILLYFTANESL